jgi:hypothetical protein
MGGFSPIDPKDAYLIQATLKDKSYVLGYARKPSPSTSPYNSWRSLSEGDFTFFSKLEAERYILTLERHPNTALSIVPASSVLGEPGDENTIAEKAKEILKRNPEAILNSDSLQPNDRHARIATDPFIIVREELLLGKKSERTFYAQNPLGTAFGWDASPDTAHVFPTYEAAMTRISKLPPRPNGERFRHITEVCGELFVCKLSQAFSYDPWGLASELDRKDPESLAAAQKACEQLHGGKSQANEYLVESVQALIVETCDEIKDMLLSKNKAYGNSALDPVRVFSRCSAQEQILVRIDDKLSRIQRGSSLGEDTVKDLIGYLVLLRVAEKMETK